MSGRLALDLVALAEIHCAYDAGTADFLARFSSGGEIWQGGIPLFPEELDAAGVRMVVLCARQYQPGHHMVSGVRRSGARIVCAPMEDDELTPQDAMTAQAAARQVVQAVRRGARVLSTCRGGINRSGLVSALSIAALTGCSGARAVEIVQEGRPEALTNESFVEFLCRIPARR